MNLKSKQKRKNLFIKNINAFLFDMLYFTLHVLIFLSLEIKNDIYEQILKKEFELKNWNI